MVGLGGSLVSGSLVSGSLVDGSLVGGCLVGGSLVIGSSVFCVVDGLVWTGLVVLAASVVNLPPSGPWTVTTCQLSLKPD